MSHKVFVPPGIVVGYPMFIIISTFIFHILDVVVPVSTASSTASLVVPIPASTYMCSSSFTPQILGWVVPEVLVVPVLAFVAFKLQKYFMLTGLIVDLRMVQLI